MCSAFLALTFATAAPCVAQVYIGRPLPKAGSVEVSGGGMAAMGEDLPDLAATLTRNPGTGLGPVTLFEADSTLTTALGAQARFGFYVSPRVAIEAGFQYARPKVEVRLSGDFEDAETTTATETVSSYLFTGSLAYLLGKPTNRFQPFLLGGGGHIRDVHEGNNLVDTGMEFHAGGGFKWWLSSGRSNRLGLRADVLASVRDGGVGAEDGRRIVPAAALSLAYLF